MCLNKLKLVCACFVLCESFMHAPVYRLSLTNKHNAKKLILFCLALPRSSCHWDAQHSVQYIFFFFVVTFTTFTKCTCQSNTEFYQNFSSAFHGSKTCNMNLSFLDKLNAFYIDYRLIKVADDWHHFSLSLYSLSPCFKGIFPAHTHTHTHTQVKQKTMWSAPKLEYSAI
jgi:hypothetical protein